MKTTNIRTYSELILIPTFEERYRYLKLDGNVCEETFGFDRYLNQEFYQRSQEWKRIRDFVILRDNGCDLGIEGREIRGKIIVHHMELKEVKRINPDELQSYLDKGWERGYLNKKKKRI